MSRVFFFLFFLVFFLSGEAYRWRVCYQQGLPRLVRLSGSFFFDILKIRKFKCLGPNCACRYHQYKLSIPLPCLWFKQCAGRPNFPILSLDGYSSGLLHALLDPEVDNQVASSCRCKLQVAAPAGARCQEQSDRCQVPGGQINGFFGSPGISLETSLTD